MINLKDMVIILLEKDFNVIFYLFLFKLLISLILEENWSPKNPKIKQKNILVKIIRNKKRKDFKNYLTLTAAATFANAAATALT